MLLPYLLKVSLLLAALTLGYRWLIQYESFSRLNRALLWLNVLAAWALPLIPLASWGPLEVQQQFHEAVPEVVQAVPVLVQRVAPVVLDQPVASVSTAELTGLELGVMEGLLIVYLLGVVGLAGRLLWQVVRMLRTISQLPSERLEGGIRLVRNAHTDSPYSFFSWIICNPDRHQPLELRHILAHEYEHVRQWHSLDLLLAEVQRVALWLNPFSWVHQRLVQGNLEYLADRAVLESGFDRKQYQLNLLKAALQTNELPLTNSFAQSLLKKRIKMMNRQPSRLWVWGKYVCLLAVLYLSSAFVAPYRTQLVALAPTPIQPVVSALIEEAVPVQKSATEPAPAQVSDAAPNLEPIEGLAIAGVIEDSLKQGKHSRWTLIKGDTIYWAISSLATLDDINKIRNDILDYGAEMKFNSFQYDPLNLFLTNISVYINISTGGRGRGDGGEGPYTPIRGYSGFIIHGGLGMGQLPPEPLLTAMKEDYAAALKLKEEHFPEYVEDSLNKVIFQKEGSFSTSTYFRKSLEGESGEKVLANTGVGKSSAGTLLVMEKYKDLGFYLNGQPSGFAEVNSIPFEKLQKISIKSVRNVDKYMLVWVSLNK